MKPIKTLHYFILKSFMPLFAMTFFIVLFIVLMQFLWRYIDDLVGKGLSFDVIAELFFYAAVSMVPMALPLAILLASLMTFGNLGEKFELTALKSSGISLVQVMKPLIVFIMFVSVGAFFFQNNALPHAQVKMWTLLFSMRQKSPELEIPEGVFYDQIPGINLYVGEKNKVTGILHDVKIYDVRRGADNATILVADSARMSLTPDGRYLYLSLWRGNQYENMARSRGMENDPFRREQYDFKEILIPFDNNFNRMDEGGMRNQYVGKNMSELQHTIDSVGARIDSLGAIFASDLRIVQADPRSNPFASFVVEPLEAPGSAPGAGGAAPSARPAPTRLRAATHPSASAGSGNVAVPPLNVDSLLASVDPSRRDGIYNMALSMTERRTNQVIFASETVAGEKKTMRRHSIELIKKFTLSVACLVFLFIGAPLGAIIRKGGLGAPLVISVLLFLVYYIIDNTGYKMARDGHVAVWFGIWLSTFILAPLGCFVTYKAMNDSAVFDPDRLKHFFRKLFHGREPRSVGFKEVVINEVDPAIALGRLALLRRMASAMLATTARPPSYAAYFKRGIGAYGISDLDQWLEETVVYLSDSRNLDVPKTLEQWPEMRSLGIYGPIHPHWFSTALEWFLPAGLAVWLFALRARRTLRADLVKIEATAAILESMQL